MVGTSFLEVLYLRQRIIAHAAEYVQHDIVGLGALYGQVGETRQELPLQLVLGGMSDRDVVPNNLTIADHQLDPFVGAVEVTDYG